MNLKEYKNLIKKKNKYHAEKCVIDGTVFASKKEAGRYKDLRLCEKAKIIRDLKMQTEFQIRVNGVLICKYKSDFDYWDNVLHVRIVEDCKGFRTPVYKLKKKLVEAIYGIEIQEI